MPSLVRVGGVLLREPGGSLARGIDCCCDEPPPCPNCCIDIVWGTFNGDGDLVQEFLPDTTIKLVMPTKNKRIVCDGENVQVVVTRHNFMDDPSGTVYVRWDRHWIHQLHDPLTVGTDGFVFVDGLIEWGTLTGDPVETFSVTLQFDKCWGDNATQFGDIEAGIRDGGDFALIYGTSCNSTLCCDVVYPCDDCCWYLSPVEADNTSGSFELDANNDPVFWAENFNGDRMKVTVDGTTSGVWCVGEEITIRVKLIPSEYTGALWYPKVAITASDNWRRTAHAPVIGNGTVVDGFDPPLAITWGSDVSATEYEASMKVPCPRQADAIFTVLFQDKNPTGVDGASIGFEWICCSAESPDHSCEDCWPPPNTDFMNCTFTLENATVVDFDVELADFNPALTVGDWILLAVWEEHNEPVPVDSTLRYVHYLFKCCSFSECNKSQAQIAFETFVEGYYGAGARSSIDCSTGLLPPDNTVQQLIDDTCCPQDPGAPAPYDQTVYLQNNDITCPPCPPVVP